MASIVLLTLSGCGGSQAGLQLNSSDSNEPKMQNGDAIAYAYMENGNKLAFIKTKYEKPKDGFEVIKINSSGFYPDYSMEPKVESGANSPGCLVLMKDTDETYKFCKSNYTERKVLYSGVAVAWNAAATVTMLGTNVATGTFADPKFFNKDTFLKIVKDNDLRKYQAEILLLRNYAYQKANEISRLYDKALLDYKNNKSKIFISYSIEDKSGLFVQSSFDRYYEVLLNIPNEKSYSYLSLFNDKTFDNANKNFKEDIALIKKSIDEQYFKDTEEYEKYLTLNFNSYKLAGEASKIMKINDNISFFVTSKAPSQEIPYKLGEKIDINIPVTIEYANVKRMIPKEYALDDINLNLRIKNKNSLNINGVISNKTSSFITIKSLTSYYGGLVHNIPSLNKEFAPESKDLNDGAQYSVITSEMDKKSNFEQITKSKAKSIKINYGYAVKYKINDTNIEKSIYNTKDYSLYDVIQEYL